MAVTRTPAHRAISRHSFFIFRATISLGYLLLGLLFVTGKVSNLMLSEEISPYFGGALVLYGGFRLYRAIMAWRARLLPPEEQEDEPVQL